MDRIQSLTQSFLSFAGAIGLLAMTVVASPSAQTAPPAPPQGWPADCAYKYSFGSGATLLRYCVTTAGNLIYLETGQGTEHIYNYTASAGTVSEGYALCADPSPAPWYQREYYDFYTYGGFYLWHPVLVSTDPLIIERTAIDNSFKLRQKFTPNPAEQELVVEMKLTNLLPVARTNVMLKRAVDFNVDSTGLDDVWDHTYYSTWAKNGSGGVAISLKGFPATFPSTQPNFAGVEWFGGAPSYPCGTESHGPRTGEAQGFVGFSMGTIAAKATKTVKVRYGHQ